MDRLGSCAPLDTHSCLGSWFHYLSCYCGIYAPANLGLIVKDGTSRVFAMFQTAFRGKQGDDAQRAKAGERSESLELPFQSEGEWRGVLLPRKQALGLLLTPFMQLLRIYPGRDVLNTVRDTAENCNMKTFCYL